VWLDAYVFAGGRRLVKDVVVGGRHAVKDRRHTGHEGIARRYRDVLARLSQI
jgi:hypothetical protein